MGSPCALAGSSGLLLSQHTQGRLALSVGLCSARLSLNKHLLILSVALDNTTADAVFVTQPVQYSPALQPVCTPGQTPLLYHSHSPKLQTLRHPFYYVCILYLVSPLFSSLATKIIFPLNPPAGVPICSGSIGSCTQNNADVI